eukprot:671216-Pyramimonas_sp.AAC.2
MRQPFWSPTSASFRPLFLCHAELPPRAGQFGIQRIEVRGGCGVAALEAVRLCRLLHPMAAAASEAARRLGTPAVDQLTGQTDRPLPPIS